MANSGYSQEWTKSHNTIGTSYIRLYYYASYNPANNKSTITVTPELKQGSNAGSYSFFDGTGTGNGGVYGNGVKLYALATSYGSTGELRGGASNSYASMSPSSGSISTFTVQHNSSGNASFTLGMYGTVHASYGPTNNGPIGSTAGNTITIHENAPYAISYNANGGSGAPGSQGVYYGVTYNISTAVPTRAGYTFAGWNTNSSGTGTDYTGGQSVTPNGNLPLYAKWTINTYTVSYDANGGEDAPEAQTKTYGQTLVLSDVVPTRTGYTFKGWATTSDASVPQYQPSGNYTANAAATLYAVWQINAYSLSITKSEAGLVLNVTRTESPIAGADTGILANGATVYYGDKLVVAYTLSAGYAIDTATINSVPMDNSSETVTVSSNMVVIVLVELQALAYIDNGASIEMYQIYIDDGVSLEPYQAYIDNGVSWDVY